MKTRDMVIVGLGAAALVLISAGASALITRNTMGMPEQTVKTSSVEHAPVRHAVHHNARQDSINWNQSRQATAQPAVQAPPPCNDGNVVGYLVGGAAGGLAGSQLGKGNGKVATTIGGTMGGAYLGGQYLPTQNVTCR